MTRTRINVEATAAVEAAIFLFRSTEANNTWWRKWSLWPTSTSNKFKRVQFFFRGICRSVSLYLDIGPVVPLTIERISRLSHLVGRWNFSDSLKTRCCKRGLGKVFHPWQCLFKTVVDPGSRPWYFYFYLNALTLTISDWCVLIFSTCLIPEERKII